MIKSKKNMIILLSTILIILNVNSGCSSKKGFSNANGNNTEATSVKKSEDAAFNHSNSGIPASSVTDSNITAAGDTVKDINSDSSGKTTGKGEINNQTSQGPVIQKPSDDNSENKPDYLNKIVYYNDYSDLFHYDKNCTNLKKGAVIKEGKLSEAIKLGHKVPCKICIPQY